jgi:hypothetical protein
LGDNNLWFLEVGPMKCGAFIAATLLVPAASFADCELHISDGSVRALTIELRDRAKNMGAIAGGYRGTDPQEGMWLIQLEGNIHEVVAELFHLRDLISIRDGVTGKENQRLVKEVFADALAGASDAAQNTKDSLLRSTSLTKNQAAVSEIARAMPALEKVVHIGDSCHNPR